MTDDRDERRKRTYYTDTTYVGYGKFHEVNDLPNTFKTLLTSRTLLERFQYR